MKRLIELGFLACVAASAAANPVTHQKPSVIERAARLSPGQFVWEPKAASTGPVFLVIDLTRQRPAQYVFAEQVQKKLSDIRRDEALAAQQKAAQPKASTAA